VQVNERVYGYEFAYADTKQPSSWRCRTTGTANWVRTGHDLMLFRAVAGALACAPARRLGRHPDLLRARQGVTAADQDRVLRFAGVVKQELERSGAAGGADFARGTWT
jgi:hypothetical protein